MSKTPENPLSAAFYDQWKILNSWLSNTINKLTDEELCSTIAPNRNHGVWILGHLIESEDELAVYLGLDNWLFPEYEAMFGQGSPLLPVAQYPHVSFLRQQWQQVSARNNQLLSTFTDAQWHQPHTRIDSGNPLDEDFFKTKGRCIAIWNIHQTLHLGQLGVLRQKWG